MQSRDEDKIVVKYDISGHARDMMNERQIPEEWVRETLNFPDYSEEKKDRTVHYIRAIAKHGGRSLRVIVNPINLRVVTLFFDRRFKKEAKE